jgi:hypothetical protein
MTKKIAISVPDDVADRLAKEPNVSAFITESVRRRMLAERVRRSMTDAGITLTDEGLANAGRKLDELQASITPELRREAAELRARIKNGRQ